MKLEILDGIWQVPVYSSGGGTIWYKTEALTSEEAKEKIKIFIEGNPYLSMANNMDVVLLEIVR